MQANGLVPVFLGEVSACRHAISSAGNQRQSQPGVYKIGYGPKNAWELRQTPPDTIAEIDRLLDHHTHGEIADILNQRGLTSGDGRPFHALIVRNIRDQYQLPNREQRLRDTGLIPLTEMATQLGVSTSTVKAWHRAGLVSGQRYNDKNEVLYNPPNPNDPLHRPKTGRPPKALTSANINN